MDSLCQENDGKISHVTQQGRNYETLYGRPVLQLSIDLTNSQIVGESCSLQFDYHAPCRSKTS